MNVDSFDKVFGLNTLTGWKLGLQNKIGITNNFLLEEKLQVYTYIYVTYRYDELVMVYRIGTKVNFLVFLTNFKQEFMNIFFELFIFHISKI